MINIDLWNDHTMDEVIGVTYTFYPNGGEYRGNILKGAEIIGDYTADSSAEIEKAFNIKL